jgi:uncharacterized membrane protein YraQ (UPF0718 family)
LGGIVGLIKSFLSIFNDMSLYMIIGLLLAGVLHAVLKRGTVAKHLGKDAGFASVKGALFGIPMPVCSCGVLPITAYLSRSGAQTSAVMAFLIATPQTGLDSIAVTLGMLGIVFAVYRPLVTFISGAAGGAIIQKIAGKKRGTEELSCSCSAECGINCEETYDARCEPDLKEDDRSRTLAERIKGVFRYAFSELLDDISLHFLIGVIIAAAITLLIPKGLFSELNIGSGLPGMLAMLVVGLPMYVCSTSSIPIALAFMAKGISPGAAFVFLFAGPATNAASIAVLVKTFGRKTVAVYLAVISIFAVGFGLLLDGIISWFSLSMPVVATLNDISDTGIVNIIAGVLFSILLIRSLAAKFLRKIRKKKVKTANK